VTSAEPRSALQRHVVRTDHDGMELELDVGGYDELYAFASTLLLLSAVPVSLLFVGVPAAAWFEYNLWWLVNEALMVERWLTVGALLTGLFWLMWPLLGIGRPYRRLRIEQRRIVLKSSTSRDRVIPTRDLRRVWVGPRGLRLEREDGTDVLVELPLQDQRLLREIGQLIAKHAEQSGSPDTIPESLQKLRGRQPAVSSPESPR
jgi:hypothetical protein